MGGAKSRTALPFAKLPCYGTWNLAGGPYQQAGDRNRRRKAGVPKEVRFCTRHELVLEMLDEHGGARPVRRRPAVRGPGPPAAPLAARRSAVPGYRGADACRGASPGLHFS
jgi:hypothetical protein